MSINRIKSNTRFSELQQSSNYETVSDFKAKIGRVTMMASKFHDIKKKCTSKFVQKH